MATFELIRTGSLVYLSTPITVSTITDVTSLVVTLTLPDGLAYVDGTVTVGTVDASDPLIPVLNIAALSTGEVSQWVPVFQVTDEASFSASDRTVTATADTVPGEVETGNNVKDYVIGGTSCADIADCLPVGLLPNSLLQGGVEWQQDLDFESTPIVYILNGKILVAEPQSITLDPADGTNPRIDVIAVNEDGDLIKITGTPAANPSKPDVNEASEVEVTFVTIAAGATVPSGFTLTDIYLENDGHPTEWNASENTAGARIDLASTAAFYAGNVGIEATDMTDGDTITLVAPLAVNTSIVDQLTFRIRSLGFWGEGRLEFTFLDGTTPVSNTVVLQHGSYFNSFNTSEFILIGFDYEDFNFSGVNADRLRIVAQGGATLSFYIDNIKYTEGYNPPTAVGDTLYTSNGQITSNRFINVNDNIVYWFNASHVVESDDVTTLSIKRDAAVDNAVTFPLDIIGDVPGGGDTGMGVGINYRISNDTSGEVQAGTEEFSYTDASNGAEDVDYKLRLKQAGVLEDKVSVKSTGQVQKYDYTSEASFAPFINYAAVLGVDSSGNEVTIELDKEFGYYDFSGGFPVVPSVNGQLSGDTANAFAFTELRIKDEDLFGFDRSVAISQYRLGDIITLTNKTINSSDPTYSGQILYQVSGTPVDNTTYWSIPVTFVQNTISNPNGPLSIGVIKGFGGPDFEAFGAGNNAVSVSNTSETVVLKTAITGGGDTITLPSGLSLGKKVTIKDAANGAGTDNITVATAGAEQIDGAATDTISTNGQAVTYVFDGANFWAIPG